MSDRRTELVDRVRRALADCQRGKIVSYLEMAFAAIDALDDELLLPSEEPKHLGAVMMLDYLHVIPGGPASVPLVRVPGGKWCSGSEPASWEVFHRYGGLRPLTDAEKREHGLPVGDES